MKNLFLAAVLIVAAPFTVQAVDVGEHAPCVVLNHIATDGSEAEHCIREPETGASTQLKVLEFFSAVCSDCHRNLPNFSQLASEFDGEVTFRLIGLDRDESLIRDYVLAQKSLINFEVALDTERDAKKAYRVFQTPTLFILDANDTVIYRHSGVLAASDMDKIRRLLKE